MRTVWRKSPRNIAQMALSPKQQVPVWSRTAAGFYQGFMENNEIWKTGKVRNWRHRQ